MHNLESGKGAEDTPQGPISVEDPWIHRSKGMKCRTCMWFVIKRSTSPIKLSESGHVGRCRKHAPTSDGYPVVFEEDWCGDHKLDENY